MSKLGRDSGGAGGPGGGPGLAVALAALTRYRRRADGQTGRECLLSHAAADARERGRRRIELVAWARQEYGMPEAFAARVYDVAVEEGLDPPFALDLVGCGVAVRGRAEEPESDGEVHVYGPPEWVAAAEVRSAEAERERRLRSSFRRLRGLLERHDRPEDALAAFADEPDVDERGY